MALILDGNTGDVVGGNGGGAGGLIKDTTTATFTEDVIEASKEVPVIVDFWAPWCGPCKTLGPALEKMVAKAGGLVRMVKVNVDDNQDLAMQFRVQSVPSVYGFKDGRPVDGFMGAVTESQIQAFIDRLTGGAKGPVEEALAVAEEALESGTAATALEIYGQILQQDPTSGPAAGGIIRAYMMDGHLDKAREVVEQISNELKSKPEVQSAITALTLAEESGGAGDIQALMDAVAKTPTDHQGRYDLALALYTVGQNEQAIEELVELVRRDRTWNDEAARRRLIEIFEALGPTHPAVITGRRQLSSVLFS